MQFSCTLKCYSSLDFFHPLKNTKTVLSLQAIQNQAAGKIWSVCYLLLPRLAKCLAWKQCSASASECVWQLTATRNWFSKSSVSLPAGHASCLFLYWECPFLFLFARFNFLPSELLFVLQDRGSAFQNRIQLFSRWKKEMGSLAKSISTCASMELCIIIYPISVALFILYFNYLCVCCSFPSFPEVILYA